MRSMKLVGACLLCECATAILCDPGKYPVTSTEPFHVAADRNDFTSEFVAQHKRQCWSQDCAKLPLSEFEIDWVQPRSVTSMRRVPGPGVGAGTSIRREPSGPP
jgi:hypothetical protein